MQIYVCVKHVPDSGALIELDGTTSFAEGNVRFIPNPFDEYGIEESLSLGKKHGGEVIIVCAGRTSAISSIRAALAMGATRAIHVVTKEQFPPVPDVARQMAKAILADGSPDLVFTGKQSIDTEGGQFPYLLAKQLGIPVINDVSGLNVTDGNAVCTCEMGRGIRYKLDASLPCVIGTTRGLNEPRYPKLPDIMKAKKKPVTEVLWEEGRSSVPSPVLTKLELVPERSGARMLAGDVDAQVTELIRILHEQERVL